MGGTHATSGAVLFLKVAPVLPWSMSPWEMAVGTCAAAGAALLPDLDHPNSSIAHALGPITGVLTHVVSTISGGHRQGTHSLLGVAVFGAITALFGLGHPLLLGVWVAFLIAIASATVNLRLARSTTLHVIVCVTAIAGLLSGAWINPPNPDLIVAAVCVGVTAHILGDMLTEPGCPPLWPIPFRIALALVRTDGPLERYVVHPVLAVIFAGQVLYLTYPSWGTALAAFA